MHVFMPQNPVVSALKIALVVIAGCALALPAAGPAHAAGVVGSGSPASCTVAALASAVQNGGAVTFNCGDAPHTIALDTALDITAPETTIDGGGKITLQGNNTRIIRHHTYGNIGSSTLTLKNLTITQGRAAGADKAANGGAIQSFFEAAKPEYKPTLNIVNVTFADNDSTLTSFSGGLSAGDFGGGAIYSQGGYVNVTDSSFTGNDANNGAGGAIHILRGNLTIANSSFSTNSAVGSSPDNSVGGAIYVDGLQETGGTFSIAGSSFTRNTTYNSGGAIHVNVYENSGPFTVDRSSFTNNAVIGGTRAQGGAIGGGSTQLGGRADTGNVPITITRSTFAGNSVKRSGTPQDGSGGALAFPQRAAITIANATFFGNSAFGSSYNANGGAIYIVNNTTPFQIINSTIANNTAGWVGGGISNSDINDAPGGILRNTIVANNTADNGPNDWNILQQCSSELTDGGNNLQWPARNPSPNYWNEVSCLEGKSGIDQRNLPSFRDPQLGPLADNGGLVETMALATSSPAFDAGNNATCPATDARGIGRPQGSVCDIGAFELVLTLGGFPLLAEVGTPGLTLSVFGAGFTANSKVLWNGQERPTTRLSATELQATIAAADLAAAGDVQISVSDSTLPAFTLRVVVKVARVYLPMIRQES